MCVDYVLFYQLYVWKASIFVKHLDGLKGGIGFNVGKYPP